MKFSFEIDAAAAVDGGRAQSIAAAAVGRQATGAINAGPAPASVPPEPGPGRGAAPAADHRDAGQPSAELLAAVAAAGGLHRGRADTNGDGNGSALNAGGAPT